MRKIWLIGLLFLSLPLWGQEYPCNGGNRYQVFRSGEDYLNALLEDIGHARTSVDMEYYWFSNDSIGRMVSDVLIQKAKAGVRVRLILDNLITPFAPTIFYNRMRDAGADIRFVHELEKMGPFSSVGAIFSMRDHRKIVVIDGRIAYTGGMNICRESYIWKDTQVRVEGPVASSLLSTFQPGVSVPEASGPVRMQVMTSEKSASLEDYYVRVLDAAQERFYVQTPYFCPPERILQAMKAAAARGVDVRVLLPERCDWGFMNELSRDHFEDLLKAGISVSLNGGVYDHSKIFICDDALTCVGTLNMDKRSFHINREVVVLFHDEAATRDFSRRFLELEAASYRVQAGESIAHGIHKPYRAFLRALDPLF